MRNKFMFFLFFASVLITANAVSIVTTVNGNPITDVDITERTKIMEPSLNNRKMALNAIIDDYIKLEYAKSIKIDVTKKEIEKTIKDHKDNPQMELFTRATIAWQKVIMATIIPSISVSDKDVKTEMNDLEQERGLPIKITILRLVKVPKSIYSGIKDSSPKSCDDAESMVKKLGGDPQKITANEYELAPEIRSEIIGLGMFKWSDLSDGKTVMVCEREKTDEWGKLDDVIKQNAIYKRALFQADQLLKQLRRKAVIEN
jgi:hypothetical protein